MSYLLSRIFPICILLLGSLCLFTSSALSDSSYETRVRCEKLRRIFVKDGNVSATSKSKRTAKKRREKAEGRITVRAAGEGMARFHIRVKRNFEGASVLLASDGPKSINIPVQFFQGDSSTSRKRSLATASLKELGDGKLRLKANYVTPRRHYETTVDFSKDCSDGRYATAVTKRYPLRRLHEGFCGSSHEHTYDFSDFDGEIDAAQFETAQVSAEATFERATVSLTADEYYVEEYGSDGAVERMLEIMNAVDLMYQEQLGIDLKMKGQTLYTSSTDPFSYGTNVPSTSAVSAFLREFAEVGPNQDHNHLFARRTLAGGSFVSGIAGVAYIGGVCSASSGGAYGLSKDLESSLAIRAAVTAHEIGHNFGGNHTTKHSSCGSTSIMNASINGATDCFSTASRNEIGGKLDGYSCLRTVSDAETGDDADDSDDVSDEPYSLTLKKKNLNNKRKVQLTCKLDGSSGGEVVQFERRTIGSDDEYEVFKTKTVNSKGKAKIKSKKTAEYRCSFDDDEASERLSSSSKRFKRKRR